jgi:universal stress protein A
MSGSSVDYRCVLAVVALGAMTERVLDRAADLGARCGASVDVANVLEDLPVFLYHAVAPDEFQALLDRNTALSREQLLQLAGGRPGIRGTHTVTGILAEETEALANRMAADLLVIGAHERYGMAILLRDRSDEILHKAARDALVVKQATPEAPPYRHVLAAVDLGERGQPVATRAARIASLYGAELTLLHVIDRFPVDRSNALIAPEDRDPLAYEREDALSQLETFANQAGVAQCRREVAVSAHKASREIPAFAAAGGVDLIVTGSHGPHGLGRLLGSTADGIVHRAPCDVLMVRLPSAA